MVSDDGTDETMPTATAGETASPATTATLVAATTAATASLPFTGLGLLELFLGGLMAICLGAASIGLASRRS
jgi:hypothetical protein